MLGMIHTFDTLSNIHKKYHIIIHTEHTFTALGEKNTEQEKKGSLFWKHRSLKLFLNFFPTFSLFTFSYLFSPLITCYRCSVFHSLNIFVLLSFNVFLVSFAKQQLAVPILVVAEETKKK